MSLGGFSNWQFAQWFAMFGLFAAALLVRHILAKPAGERKTSRAVLPLLLVAVFTVANIAWYTVDSQPFWQARGRLNESFDILDEVVEIELASTNPYGVISVHNSRRPPIWPPNCQSGRLFGRGVAQFLDPITPADIEAIAQYLEDDGFTVQRSVDQPDDPAFTPTYSVVAVNGPESYSYSFTPGADIRLIPTRVDFHCPIDVAAETLLDCENCVESFVTTE